MTRPLHSSTTIVRLQGDPDTWALRPDALQNNTPILNAPSAAFHFGSLVADYRTQTILWADRPQGQIRRVNLTTNSPQIVTSQMSQQVRDPCVYGYCGGLQVQLYSCNIHYTKKLRIFVNIWI